MNPKKLVRKVLPRRGIALAEESYRKGRVYALQASAGFPARGLKVIAVTGTDGKTTTCSFINEMLKSAGYKTAMFTTAQIELNGKIELNRTHRTVVLTAQLVSLLKRARAAKVDYVVLETTSAALHQHKLIGIPLEVAVMTNLSPEHLDYHKTMENYAAAKARLFNGYMRPKCAVLNRDDAWYDFFAKEVVGDCVSYGIHKDSGAKIGSLSLSKDGSDWTLKEHGMTLRLHTSLPGRFNVWNASAAACVGLLVGLSQTQIEQGIAALHLVPGRMQKIEAGQNFTVLVDYAVTAEALGNALRAARELTKGRVLVVFGATGDRDKTKRPVMGETAAQLADKTYLTDDETYTEDPTIIRAAVRVGLEKGKGEFVEIADRREAITRALKDARKGDVVLLAGIGHQDTRNMGGKLEPWNEADVARELLSIKS